MSKEQTSYTTEKLVQACQAVKKGMSLRKAAEAFNVPKTTIHSRLHNRTRGKRPDCRKDEQTVVKEQRIVNWYVYCKQTGFFYIHNRRLIKEAKTVLREPSSQGQNFDSDWCQQFIERHKRVQTAIRLGSTGKSNANATLETWFKAIGTFCRERGMLQCLRQPLQLLYCCKLQLGENVKVMLTYSSHGLATPPFLVQENLNQMDAEQGFNTDCDLPNGWIKYNCLEDDENDTNMYFLKHVLDKSLKQENILYPILLFMDFLNWPLSLKLYELCCKLNIFIINSYPSAFKYTKDIQQQLTSDLQNSRNKTLNSKIRILQTTLKTQLTKQKMYLNFLESGIYPFDIANIRLAPKLKCEIIYSSSSTSNQVVPVAIQKVQPTVNPTVKPTYVKVSTDILPKINETKRQSDIVLNFNEFTTILGPDTLYKLQMSLHARQPSNSAEFNALLKIYRKFYTSNDVVIVKNEPLIDEPQEYEYLEPEVDIQEDIKPFN